MTQRVLTSVQLAAVGKDPFVAFCQPAKDWADLREDKMVHAAPGFWPIFGPLGAHGGPREPRERPRLET